MFKYTNYLRYIVLGLSLSITNFNKVNSMESSKRVPSLLLRSPEQEEIMKDLTGDTSDEGFLSIDSSSNFKINLKNKSDHNLIIHIQRFAGQVTSYELTKSTSQNKNDENDKNKIHDIFEPSPIDNSTKIIEFLKDEHNAKNPIQWISINYKDSNLLSWFSRTNAIIYAQELLDNAAHGEYNIEIDINSNEGKIFNYITYKINKTSSRESRTPLFEN